MSRLQLYAGVGCSVEGCGRAVKAKGRCVYHYQLSRWQAQETPRILEMVALYNDGKSIREIGRAFKITPQRVHQNLQGKVEFRARGCNGAAKKKPPKPPKPAPEFDPAKFRRCSSCRQIKDLSRDNFTTEKAGVGFSRTCKPCAAEISAKRYALKKQFATFADKWTPQEMA